MIKETSKRISLPKQSAQSCQAASRGEGGLGRGGRPDGTSPFAPRCFSEQKKLKKMIQTCVNSWEKHPSRPLLPPPAPPRLCESDKNNATNNPAEGDALNGSVFPVREGHRQSDGRTDGAGPRANTHQGSTFPSPPPPTTIPSPFPLLFFRLFLF